MKFLCLLLWTAGALAAQLANVHAVYVLPMQGGLDQYLAARLAGAHTLPVVTDPRLADAVFTDHLGAGFEQELKGMRVVEAHKTDAKEDARADSKADAAPPPHSSFGRGHGTVFLVDIKSRQVLWSAYQKSLGRSPDAMHRTAKRVVADLEKALGTRTKPPA